MKKIVTINFFYSNSNFSNEIQYAARQLFRNTSVIEFNIQFNKSDFKSDYVFKYGMDIVHPNEIQIAQQKIIFRNDIKEKSSIFVMNKYFYKSMEIYSVENNRNSPRNFIKDNRVEFDLIESIFFHLTRYEEGIAIKEDFDNHLRVKSSAQLLVREKLQMIPVVDHMRVALLMHMSLLIEPEITKHKITHDIDCLRKFGSFTRVSRAIARTIIKDHSLSKTLNLAKQLFFYCLTKKDPFNTFDWLFSLNKTKDRVVFFMSGGTTRYDNLYDIRCEEGKNAIKLALDNSYEIGIHPSYITFTNEEQLRKEITLLNEISEQDIFSSRQHILRYSIEETPRILDDNGIRYDYTLGYSDKIGFRCGTGHEFCIFCLVRRKELPIKEIPLVVMDGPLLVEANYDIQRAEEILFNFIESNNHHTMITYNIHNSIFGDASVHFEQMKALYTRLTTKLNDHV